MPVQLRIFVLLGGLVAAIVLAEWFLVRTLAQDLSAATGHVALDVGESLFETLSLADGPDGGEPDGGKPDGGELAGAELALGEPDGAAVEATAGPRAGTFIIRKERIISRGGATAVWHGSTEDSQVLPAQGGGTSAHHETDIDVVVRTQATDGKGEPSQGPARAGNVVVYQLSVDSQHAPRFLELTGPHVQRRIPIPRAGVEAALELFFSRLFTGTLLLLLVGLGLAALVAQRVAAPLRSLARAAREVGEGELGTRVETQAGGEVGEAVEAFNRMSERLAILQADAEALRSREHLSEIGEIARGLAHGLRNPLHAVGLALDELASTDADSGERAPLAEGARRHLRRVDASVRSLLALGASGERPARAPVDVGVIAEDVALEALQEARGRVGIDVAVAPEAQPVEGVAAELRAALQALVVNAVDASPDGGRVAVRVQPRDGGGVVVEVCDAGPGLPPEVRSRLFTPHVTTKANGTGMGLFLAHRLVVARHGGRLALEDAAPHGTRAVMQLPAVAEAASRG